MIFFANNSTHIVKHKLLLKLSTVLIFFIPVLANAQSYDIEKLAVEWKLEQNNYQGRDEFEATFVFHNKSNQLFPAGGWRLYFSYPRTVLSVTDQKVTFKNVNGEFCVLYPATGFTSIKPDDKGVVKYIAKGKSFSYTDAPSGLYLVWDQFPEQALPIKQYTINAVPQKEALLLKKSPALQYEINKHIEPVKTDSLTLFMPTPVKVREGNGVFNLNRETVIVFDSLFINEAKMAQEDIGLVLGSRPFFSNPKVNSIVFKKVTGLSKEAYRISIRPEGINLEASHPAGAFYAFQSIKQLLPVHAWGAPVNSLELRAVTVEDAPRFSYRSLMLDVARNFQTKQEVLKVIDLLALYKINTLHFHLTDDEGWRLEIPTLPELTTVGANRGHTTNENNRLLPAYGSGAIAGNKPGSGYYSKADFIEILKYASARHIQVIPELETPGHARAAIKAMNARYIRLSREGKQQEAEKYLLQDTSDQSVYRSVQGYHDNVMNVALPSVYRFIEELVEQVQAMYTEAYAPLSTIHLGGDEVPAGVWQRSPAAMALMKQDPHVKTTDDFWYYYLSKVNDILQQKKLYLSGWEEVAMRKTKLDGKQLYIPNPDFVKKDFHAYVWNNVWGWGMEDLAYRLANAGYKVVLSPVTNFYFDLAYEKDADEPGLYWGGYLNEEKPFYFNPFDYYKTAKETPDGKKVDAKIFERKERLTDYGRSNIVGLQAQIWSEKISSPAALEYMLLPKLISFAERAWASQPSWAQVSDSLTQQQLYEKAWSLFVNKMATSELPRLDYFAGGFQYRIPPPGVLVQQGMLMANSYYPAFKIHYTTDGAEPSLKSPVYEAPISIKSTIKLAVFNGAGHKSRTIIVQQP